MRVFGLLVLGAVLGFSGVGRAQGVVDPCSTAPQSCATVISTRATARTRIPNTVVDVTAGVEAMGKDMAEVQRQISASSGQLMGYLKAQGAERVMTEDFSFNPETQAQKNGPDRVVGYRGSVQVSFRTTPAKAPELLGGVLQHGANTVDGTNFLPTEEEMATAQRAMGVEAAKMARSEAEAIAGAAGMKVVAVRTINVQEENGTGPQPYFRAKAMGGPMAAAAPIATEAGDQQVTASVDMTVAAK